MWETICLAVGAVLAIAVSCLYSLHLNKNNIYTMLIKQFGTKPEPKEYDFDQIKMFWKERKNEKYPGGIDDITWNDLDMDQVFGRINICCSSVGEQYLYMCLRNPGVSYSKMESLEEKITYVKDNESIRIEIQQGLMRIGKRKNNYYISAFLNDLDSYKLDNIWIYYFLQIILFASIVLGIFLRHSYAYAFLGIVFLININVYALMKHKYEINMDLLVSIQSILQISKGFARKKEKVLSSTFKENLKTIDRLTRSMSLINGRHQRKYTADFMELCAMYITGAFLFDFVLYNRLLMSLKSHLKILYELYESLGEWDMAISIASFRESVPLFCIPQFCEDRRIAYREIYNPLLDHPVCNDFCLDTNCIITGSNASGKSTFIKAVAMNAILAMSIHTCTARTAEVSKADIYTSIAIRDDLLAGESYFVREIKSLRRVIDASNEGRFVIAVIDEILRGTNTRERIAASASILKYLEKRNCMVLVASHDLELIRLLKNGRYANYYFCEKADGKEIIFDYKIHPGICRQQNAIKLLEVLGFPEDIIEDANEYAINI